MINKFIQSRFFKKRVIFKSALPIDCSSKEYEVQELTQGFFEQHRHYLERKIPKDRLSARMNNSDISGFIVLNKETDEIAGFQWLLYSSNNEYTHDNYKISPNTGFLFNAYIDPKYRKKGLFTLLKSEIVKYHYKKTGNFDLLSVVESLNHSSTKVNLKLGSVQVGKNYLCKLWGRNIFVITKQNKRLIISWASRKRL